MSKKGILIALFFLLTLILSGCAPLDILRYFGVLRPAYTYEGYIVDFSTKEPIPNAIIQHFEKTIVTNDKGYFEFKEISKWEDWRETIQMLDEVKAYGYGALFNWTIETNIVNTIPLAPPNSAYGRLIFEGERGFKLKLVGPNCGFEVTTYTNSRGEFCFSNIPINEHLEIFISEGDIIYSKSYIFEIDGFFNRYIEIRDELVEE